MNAMRASEVNLINRAVLGTVPGPAAERLCVELADRITLDLSGFPSNRPDMYYSGAPVSQDAELAAVRFGVYDTVDDELDYGLSVELEQLAMEQKGDGTAPKVATPFYVAAQPIAAIIMRPERGAYAKGIAVAVADRHGCITHTTGRTGNTSLEDYSSGFRQVTVRRPASSDGFVQTSQTVPGVAIGHTLGYMFDEFQARWMLDPLYAENLSGPRRGRETTEVIANRNLARIGTIALDAERRLRNW